MPDTLTTPAPANEQFVWTDHWYPLLEVADLDKTRPMPFTLLNQPIVIWYDRLAGAYRAFRDVCPHRLIPLSEGRINERGLLECGYHGWEFAGSGDCQHIPQAVEDSVGHTSPRACAESYPCEIKQGLLWVKPIPFARAMQEGGGMVTTSDIPVVREVEAEPDEWVMGTITRDIPYDYATLLENVLDVSHVPFTHHGSVGNRKNAAPVELQVTTRSPGGFEGYWPTGPRRGYFGPQSTEFIAPSLMRHTLAPYETRGFVTMTVVYCIPVAPGRCRLLARFPFKFKNKLLRKIFTITPRWLSHNGQMSILEDDQIFLHAQEREIANKALATGKKSVGALYYMPTAADAFISAFRAWLDRYASGGPFGSMLTHEWLQAAGPRQNQAELLERYDSHTKRCSSCRTALRRIETAESLLKTVAPVLMLAASLCAATAATWIKSSSTSALVGKAAKTIAASSLAIGPVTLDASQLVTLTAILGLVGGVSWLVASWMARFKQRYLIGGYPPPRNAPIKMTTKA